jgi:hypothetical protein
MRSAILFSVLLALAVTVLGQQQGTHLSVVADLPPTEHCTSQQDCREMRRRYASRKRALRRRNGGNSMMGEPTPLPPIAGGASGVSAGRMISVGGVLATVALLVRDTRSMRAEDSRSS